MAPATPLQQAIHDTLADLAARRLLREPVTLESLQGPRVRIDGREVLNLSSNNALDLAGEPSLKRASVEAVERWGCGGAASRLVSGSTRLHEALEARIARFEDAGAAILFPTGYMANLGTIQALVGRGDAVFIDRLSHASIVDGARLSGARLRTYAHADPASLEARLARCDRPGRLVVTDSIFSMDGDLAPLSDLCEICERHGALLMVDEAHATGVLGPRGAGAVEALGLAERVPVRMGTLSKACGSLGGFVAGTRELVSFLRNRARSYIFTTSPPPAVLGASLAAFDWIEANPGARAELCKNARDLWQGLQRLGYACGAPGEQETEPAAHIVPVLAGSVERALAFSAHLFENGILAPAIRPPTVPEGSARIRLSLMRGHGQEVVEQVLKVFARYSERTPPAGGDKERTLS